MLHKLLFFVSAVLWSRDARAQVTGGSATAVLGGSAILPCKLTQLQKDDTLEQISWKRKTKGKPQTDNFLTIKSDVILFVNGNDKRFEFIGNFSRLNGSLQLSNVSLDDEGSYTCIFSVFPTGSLKTDIPLSVHVLPSVTVRDDKPTLGDKDIPLATCIAADAKPAPNVTWNTGTLTQSLTQNSDMTQNPNGTYTITTTLYGKPTKEIHGSSVQCVVISKTLKEPSTLPFKIQVYYPPEEVKVKKTDKDKDSFECTTDANPSATVIWTRNGQPLQHATLQFTKLTTDLSGLYQCEATNKLGSKNGFLYLHVTPGDVIGWIFFGLLFALNLIVASLWCLRKRGIIQRFPFFESDERQPVQTTSSSPEHNVAESLALASVEDPPQ